MVTKRRYEKRLNQFLEDQSLCKENRKLFRQFFEFEEYKLKRRNNLRSLDDGCYRTLYKYITLLKNVNKWFDNKPLSDITKEDIKKVYDKLEDGLILKDNGKPYECTSDYYNKVFKGKLFKMIGKAHLSDEILEFRKKPKNNDVRFIKEDTFKKLVEVMVKPMHKTLAWLAFDIGENINSLLQLKKKDFVREINELTKSAEYRVNLYEDILKRSRTARNEVTNYEETVMMLDVLLKDLKDNDRVFPIEYRAAEKFLSRAVKITEARCIPKGQPVTWKDLRSSMACDLLTKGYTLEEVNARLGHKPSSREIDKYVNFLALERKAPKKKVTDFTINKLNEKLKETEEREKLQSMRMEKLKEEMDEMKSIMIAAKKVKEKSYSQNQSKEQIKQLLSELIEKGELGG